MSTLPKPSLLWTALVAGLAALRLWSELGASPGGLSSFEVTAASPVQQSMQLFYSTTEHPGISEVYSVRVPLNSTRPEKYRFRLPAGRYTAFRLDPMAGSGVVTLQDVRVVAADGKTELHRSDPTHWVRNEEIASIQIKDRTVEITVDPGQDDPILTIPLPSPIDLGADNGGIRMGCLAFAGAFSLVLVLARLLQPGQILAGLGRLIEFTLTRLTVVAARMFPEKVLPVDRTAVSFLLAVTAICFAAALFGLHGSSTTVRGVGTYFPQGEFAPLVGSPKSVRADEWAFHTPLILNQTSREQPLALNGGAGPDAAVLVANLPARHWSTAFRPQFWPFFVLSPARAFAVYWQAKTFLLLAGTFLLFLLLTRSSACAALGALWFYFSSYTQWGFSWPALLPEMIGLISLGVVLAGLLFVAPTRRHLVAYSFLLALVATNFALCAYPPFQVPLAWAAAGTGLAWLVGQHFTPNARPRWLPGLAALACTLIFVAGAMLLFMREIRPVIEVVSNTIYPGKRSFHGGGVRWEWFASSFIDWAKSEHRIPPAFGNVCEGVGFFWLAPAILLLLGRTDRRSRIVIALMAAPALLLAAWMALPVPASWGKLLLLDMAHPGRATPALGLLNIALVVTLLSSRTPLPAPWRSLRLIVLVGAVLAGAFGCLRAMNLRLDGFFAVWELWAAAAGIALAVAALVAGWRAAFAVVVLLPLAWSNAFVNPVDHGFPAYERTALRQFVDEHRLRDGRWIVISDDFSMPQYFVALGLDVFNAFKFVPALDDWRQMDPAGHGRGYYNQSGMALTHLLPPGSPPRYEPMPFAGLPPNIWHLGIDPADPRLSAIGVRYIALPGAPRPDLFAAADFDLLTPDPVTGFTIYRRR